MMMDLLYQIDKAVFYFINHNLSNSFFDKFLLIISDVKSWYVAYVILWLLLIIKGGRLGRIAGALILILITVADQFSSSLLKNLIERVRPCHVLDDVNLLVSCKNSFSFPSSHAVNNFAAATFFARLYPKYKIALFTAAAIVALTRPYLGIHYPSDILGGAIIGAGFGYIFSLAAIKINKYFENKTNRKNSKLVNEN